MDTFHTSSKDLCTEEQFYLVVALEYYDSNIKQLEKEQQTIWRRGALSPQQELREEALDIRVE